VAVRFEIKLDLFRCLRWVDPSEPLRIVTLVSARLVHRVSCQRKVLCVDRVEEGCQVLGWVLDEHVLSSCAEIGMVAVAEEVVDGPTSAVVVSNPAVIILNLRFCDVLVLDAVVHERIQALGEGAG